MALRRWRRTHGPDLRARVEPADDARWVASIWRGETCLHQKRRRFRLLTDAHAAADALLREELGHECDRTCGEWRPEST